MSCSAGLVGVAACPVPIDSFGLFVRSGAGAAVACAGTGAHWEAVGAAGFH